MSLKFYSVLLVLAASPSFAAVIHVGGGKDGSGVTYSTLSEASAKLHDGDEIVIEPGIYHESLKLHGHTDVTVRASGPGVVIDEAISVSGNQLTPMAGSSGGYQVKVPTGNPRLVFVDGHLLMPRIDEKTRDEFGGFGQGTGPLTSKDVDRWIWDSKDRQLELNLSSRTTPHDVEITGSGNGVELLDCHHVRIEGLTVQHCGNNIDVEEGGDNIIQNCVVLSGMNGIYLRSNNCTVRHNTIFDNDRHGIAGGGQRNTIEQNLIERNGHNINKTARFYTGGIKRNHGSFEVIDYNIITDTGGASVWGDLDCIANLIYGNSIAHSSSNGFYMEWTQRQNNVSFNSVMDCGSGLMFRCSQENLVRRNWFFDTASVVSPNGEPHGSADGKKPSRMLGISFLDTTIIDGTEANVVDDNLVQVSGDAVAVAGHDEANALAAGDTGVKDGGPVYNFALTNQLIGNYYTRPSSAIRFGEVFKQPVANLDELKQKTGWEATGHVGQFGAETIWQQSPIWWPVPVKDDILWMPILLNGNLSLRDRGNNDDEAMGWQPTIWSDEPISWIHWSRYGGFTPVGDANQSAVLAWNKTDARDHGNYLEALGLKPEMPKGGVGWRGVLLPALPGTTFSASLEVRTKDLKPFSSESAVKGGIIFTDSVGTVIGQEWLTGKDESAAGSLNWKTLERNVVVPQNADRLQWYLGIDAVQGTVDFASINMTDIHSGSKNGSH